MIEVWVSEWNISMEKESKKYIHFIEMMNNKFEHKVFSSRTIAIMLPLTMGDELIKNVESFFLILRSFKICVL